MAGTLNVVIPVCFGVAVFVAFVAVVAVRILVNWRRQKRKNVALANNSLHMLVRSTQPLDFVPLLIQERLVEEREDEEIGFNDVESPCVKNATSKENICSQQRMRKKPITGRHNLKRRSVSDTSLYASRFPDLDLSGPITSLRRESQFFDAAVGRGRSLSSTQSDGSESEAPFGSTLALDTKPFSSMSFPRQRKHPIVARRASEDILEMSRSIAAAKKAGVRNPLENVPKSITSSAGTTRKRSSHVNQRRFSVTTKPSYTEKTSTPIKKPKMPVKRGRVDFKISYLQEGHTLQVHLINATELPMKHGNLLNSFARLSLRTPAKHQRHQSRVHKKTCNPIFDEMFVFDGVHVAELSQTWLKIKLLNRDSISMFERIGETMLWLSDENLLRGDTVSRELVDKAKKDQCVGQLLLSVCHHATSSQVKVSIMKLKDLPKSTKSMFVTLELTYAGHTLQKHQSKTRRQSISFNEEFSFVVSTDSSCTLENFGVQFTVYQRDFIHGNEVIGRVRLGMDAPLQSEIDHWQAIVLSPHKSITDWHRLHENL